MPSTALSVMIQRGDPQHSWKWVYGQEALPFGLPYQFVEACSLSFNNIAAGNPIFMNAGFMQMPGTHSVAPISLTFFVDGGSAAGAGGHVIKWIELWKSKVKDFKTGLYNSQSEFKKEMKFQLLSTSGMVATTLKYTGCFPTDTGALDLNYSESGHLQLTQQFAVDDVEIL